MFDREWKLTFGSWIVWRGEMDEPTTDDCAPLSLCVMCASDEASVWNGGKMAMLPSAPFKCHN